MKQMVTVMLVAVALASACQGGDGADVNERAAARAAEAREHIDGLADQLGGAESVLQDDIGPCEPGDGSGLDLVYVLRVPVELGAADRLHGEIADGLEADGWTVRRDADRGNEVSVRFLRDTLSMGAVVDESVGFASVSGSGGCVR